MPLEPDDNDPDWNLPNSTSRRRAIVKNKSIKSKIEYFEDAQTVFNAAVDMLKSGMLPSVVGRSNL